MMASEAMATQDQSEDSQANRNVLAARDSPLEEQYPPGMDYAMKVRKPYTITKQRERWSEEEHNKFLEALKLYGRAWRKIEEHVGTKTAVQIRSHAQKFFSKVARESTNEELTLVKPIEIPPPRPKRKPMHPYPRKLTSLLKAERSTTPNLSISELENQSPTSVLSAVGSEFHGKAESSSQNGSLLPVSSAGGGKCGGLVFSESTLSAEPSESPLEDHLHPIVVSDDREPMKLELFPDDATIVQDEIVEETSSQMLKLFGKTVLVTDSIRPSSHMPDTCKSLSSDMNDEIHDQTFACNFSPERAFDQICIGSQAAALYYGQFLKDYSNQPGSGSGSALPWWGFYAGLPFFNASLRIPVPTKANQSFVSEQNQDIDVNKETGWSSNTSELHKECSEKVLLVRQEAVSDKPLRGFVPYKKQCMREEDTNSSTLANDESEEKRFRLCL